MWPRAYSEGMTSPGEARGGEGRGPSHEAAITALRKRVDEERRRAARAESIAVGYETRLAGAPERLRELRSRMAALHRRMETRHKTSALLHELHAVRLEVWMAAGREPASPPGFMSTVVSAIGVPSATATVRGCHGGMSVPTLIASSSDAVARAAHDLEVAVGEGPALTAMAEGTWVSAGEEALDSRWPVFGPAVSELGVRSVLAVPLRSAEACVGTLCVYGQEPVLHDTVTTVTGRIAEAVTHTVLLADDDGGLFAETDYEPAVSQAACAVAVQRGWRADDAEDLIRARAFADSRPAADVAAEILRGEQPLE